jgi:hypothetical protein
MKTIKILTIILLTTLLSAECSKTTPHRKDRNQQNDTTGDSDYTGNPQDESDEEPTPEEPVQPNDSDTGTDRNIKLLGILDLSNLKAITANSDLTKLAKDYNTKRENNGQKPLPIESARLATLAEEARTELKKESLNLNITAETNNKIQSQIRSIDTALKSLDNEKINYNGSALYLKCHIQVTELFMRQNMLNQIKEAKKLLETLVKTKDLLETTAVQEAG